MLPLFSWVSAINASLFSPFPIAGRFVLLPASFPAAESSILMAVSIRTDFFFFSDKCVGTSKLFLGDRLSSFTP